MDFMVALPTIIRAMAMGAVPIPTRPEFLRPMIVMKRPMPVLMAYLRFRGIASKILSRRLVSEMSAKTTPSTKMAASATSQL